MKVTAKYSNHAKSWTGTVSLAVAGSVRGVRVVRGSPTVTANQRMQQGFNVGSTVNYTYDPIGQLQVADCATASEDRGYTYDTAWNLRYRTNNTTLNSFFVDVKNQLTNAPGGNRSYDGNGNLVESHATGPDLFYTYDDENRLTTVEREEVWRSEFTYDGLGRLRVRKEYDFDEGWNVTSETRYVYDGWRVIQERNSSNVPQVSYTRGTDLSGTMEGAGGIGGFLARSHGYSSGNWSTHNFYHADGNGNVTYLVNSSQTLAAKYRYDPYGNTISSSGSLAAANTYRFSSKELHLNSGLYYYGYRFYEPNFQRWLTQDPKRDEGLREIRSVTFDAEGSVKDRSRRVGSKQNFENPYVSGFNTPLNRIDPLGLDAPGCDFLPDSWDSACTLECCARHDQCFDTNNCSGWSWLWTFICPIGPCAGCNWEAVDCFSQCIGATYSDNPFRDNYYCGVCHEYFNLPTPASIYDPQINPHFGHRTN